MFQEPQLPVARVEITGTRRGVVASSSSFWGCVAGPNYVRQTVCRRDMLRVQSRATNNDCSCQPRQQDPKQGHCQGINIKRKSSQNSWAGPRTLKVAPYGPQQCCRMDEGSCTAAGCCWSPVDPNPENLPWCFFSDKKVQTCKLGADPQAPFSDAEIQEVAGSMLVAQV